MPLSGGEMPSLVLRNAAVAQADAAASAGDATVASWYARLVWTDAVVTRTYAADDPDLRSHYLK